MNVTMAETCEKDKTSGVLYHSPAAHVPTVARLQSIADNLGFDLSDEDIKTNQGFLKDWLESCNVVDRLPEPTLPVKYGRIPGYRPGPEENKYNAWYWKTNIKGAASGKLQGKKIAIKDNIAVAGVPMMNGCRLMEGYTPEFDATVVTRVLDAGGLIMGKAACEDMCYSGGSHTTAKAPVLNPHDPSRSAGGSSCGCGALLALGEVDMAIGGDQGGSVRLPACWCGVVGFKATYGLIPYTGAFPIEVTVDHLGPMTRTVHDCALLLEVLAGYDNGLDARQRSDVQPKEYTKALTGDLAGVKVGILKEGFGLGVSEADVDAMVRGAAQSLSSVGASVQDVSVPMHKDGLHIWAPICSIGAYQTMIQAGGLGVGHHGFYPTSMIEYMRRAYITNMNDMSKTMKGTCLHGEYLAQEYGQKFYNKASNLRPTLTASYDEVLKKVDVLLMPTIPYKAQKIPLCDADTTNVVGFSLGMVYNTAQFDVTGHPVLSMNAGFSEGLPVGMTIVGRHWDECTVLKVAHAYETIRDKK